MLVQTRSSASAQSHCRNRFTESILLSSVSNTARRSQTELTDVKPMKSKEDAIESDSARGRLFSEISACQPVILAIVWRAVSDVADLAVAVGSRSAPTWHSPDAQVLQERGVAHENACLAHLEAQGVDRSVSSYRPWN